MRASFHIFMPHLLTSWQSRQMKNKKISIIAVVALMCCYSVTLLASQQAILAIAKERG